VVLPVDLDDEPVAGGDEVADEASERYLTTKGDAVELAIHESAPEESLRW
jgi:hypothetical protein